MIKCQINCGPSTPAWRDYEAFGCRVNSIGVEELFRRYEDAGFLYPDKRQRLAPFWGLVRDNWQRSLRGGELIHYVVSAELDNGAWASVTSWRSTVRGWHTQHLVGIGGPAASRAVMLSTQAVRIRDQFDRSLQNWFRRSNRFANKVFGSILSTLGPEVGWVRDYGYFAFPRDKRLEVAGQVKVRVARHGDAAAIRELATESRSPVYVEVEELDIDDLCLESVDDLYRKVGLRRYRRVLLAELGAADALAGAALVYRGPLGLNFSFLENRCDLLISPRLDSAQQRETISALLAAGREHYADFPSKAFPVIVDRCDSEIVDALGGEHVRNYAQSAWLCRGFEKWYQHVDTIYNRVTRFKSRTET